MCRKLCSYTKFSIHSATPPFIKSLLILQSHKLFLFPRKIQIKNSIIILMCTSSVSLNLKTTIYIGYLDGLKKNYKNSLFISFFSFFWVSFFWFICQAISQISMANQNTKFLCFFYFIKFSVVGLSYHS